jgi:integrase
MPPRRRRGGWRTHKGRIEARVTVHDGAGGRRTTQFPLGTDPATLQEWIDTTFYDYRKKHPSGAAGTLAADVPVYLTLLVDRPALKRDRELHLAWWCERFGQRARHTLESHELEAALRSLTADGYAASTVKKYRTALFHLFTKLDGKAYPNPLRDVPPPREPDALPRAMPDAIIAAIFAAMPDLGQGVRFQTRPPISKTKARLRVMTDVGLAPVQVMAITPADIDWTDRSLLVHGRKKGHGTRSSRLPLSDVGLEALRAFAAADAFGKFSTSSARKVFVGAVDRMCTQLEAKPETHAAGAQLRKELAAFGPRPYDLRHSRLTKVYQVSGDIRATQLLATHADVRMTHRYTLAAVDPRLRAVTDLLNLSPRTKPEPDPTPAETGRKRPIARSRTARRKPAKRRTKVRKIV